MSARELNALLSRDMRALCDALSIEQNKKLSNKKTLKFGSKGSLTVQVGGNKVGAWYDHEAGKGGGPLQLIEHVSGKDWQAARDWAREYLGEDVTERLPSVIETSSATDDDDEKLRIGKAQRMYARSVPVRGTPAETYLQSRGITKWPDSFRYLAPWRDYKGGLIAPATNADGNVQAVQIIRLTSRGDKLLLDAKRTHGVLRGAGVRLPGNAPAIIAEGIETALSVWLATGRETWAALGTAFARPPVSDGAAVTVAADDFEPGSPAGKATLNAVGELQQRDCIVSLTHLDHGAGDFNDIHQERGLDAVREIIGAAPVAPRQGDVAAYYPAPKGSLRAAAYQITDTMDQFMADVTAFWNNEPDPGQGNLEHILNEKKPTDSLLITPTGSGKSTIGRNYVERILDKFSGKSVSYGTPRHNLNEEQAAPLRAALGDKYKVAIHRGFSADDPKAPGEKMCRKHKEAASIQSAGGDIETMLCGTGKGKPRCELCNKCGIKRQEKENTGADVWLYAHNLMVHETPSFLGDIAANFVDESPIDCFLGGTDSRNPVILSFSAIRDVCEQLEKLEQEATKAARQWSDANDFNAERMRLTALLDALKGHPDGKIKTDGLPDLTSVGRMIWRTLKELNIKPDTPRREFETEIALKGPYNQSVRLVALLVNCVKEASGGIIPGLNKHDDGISLAWRLQRAKGWNVPTVFMDATARPEIYQALFPTIADDRISRVECAAPHMKVRQINWNGSRNKLVPNDKKPSQANTARKNIKRVWRYVECRAHEFKGQGADIDGKTVDVLVITYKATRKELEALGLPDNVEVAHFGNLTGLDRWKGVRCLITVGRPAVGVSDVELLAEIIKGDEIIPLPDEGHNESPEGKRSAKFNQWYAQETVGARRRGEDVGPELPREYHTDPIAEAVRWTLNEGQLIQGIGRSREIRRTEFTQIQVDIITDVPLPVEVDEFLTWKQAQPSPFDLMAARGVLMDCETSQYGFWDVVAATLPDVFKNTKAARNWSERSPSLPLLLKGTTISKRGSEGLGRANVKIDRYGVPILFHPGTDLSALFPNAHIEILEPARPAPAPLAHPDALIAAASVMMLGQWKHMDLPPEVLNQRMIALRDWQPPPIFDA